MIPKSRNGRSPLSYTSIVNLTFPWILFSTSSIPSTLPSWTMVKISSIIHTMTRSLLAGLWNGDHSQSCRWIRHSKTVKGDFDKHHVGFLLSRHSSRHESVSYPVSGQKTIIFYFIKILLESVDRSDKVEIGEQYC